MINFYPGPSKIDERLPVWLKEGMESGMLSMNHRSEDFMHQYNEILDLFREVFYLPPQFEVYFISSATECWEIVSQSFSNKSFLHLFNGAFGKKWFEMNTALGSHANAMEYNLQDFPPDLKDISEEVICLCHNETSNGSKVPDSYLKNLRDSNPDQIIAIDATSSMAGISLPWLAGDIWFASVQKCFGLPAGMGIMFCNQRVLAKIEDQAFYNHIGNLHKNFSSWQTTHTPNVANVYYLWQYLQEHKGMDLQSEKIKNRARHLYQRFEKIDALKMMVKEKELRSDTVLTIEMDENDLDDLKNFLETKDIIIGKGYGDLKNRTFRIANFPAIKREEYEELFEALKEWQEEKQ